MDLSLLQLYLNLQVQMLLIICKYLMNSFKELSWIVSSMEDLSSPSQKTKAPENLVKQGETNYSDRISSPLLSICPNLRLKNVDLGKKKCNQSELLLFRTLIDTKTENAPSLLIHILHLQHYMFASNRFTYLSVSNWILKLSCISLFSFCWQ